MRLLRGGSLPLTKKEGQLLWSPLRKKGEGAMVVTWDAVYKIAELLIQTGLLVCAIQTLIHLKKK